MKTVPLTRPTVSLQPAEDGDLNPDAEFAMQKLAEAVANLPRRLPHWQLARPEDVELRDQIKAEARRAVKLERALAREVRNPHDLLDILQRRNRLAEQQVEKLAKANARSGGKSRPRACECRRPRTKAPSKNVSV